MAYNYLEIRSFQGLFLQQNSFQVPDGAMEIASRVIIRSDEVITKTNGLYEYWRPDGVSDLDDIRATYTFQGKLLGFFATGIGNFADTFPYGGTFNAVGVLTENETEIPLSFQYGTDFSEQSKNLYFTADQGIYKLESYDGKALRAGIPQGLGLRSSDIPGFLTWYVSDGVLPPNSQTAYRAVFGRRDPNGNLLLSAPSDILTFGVPEKKVGVTYTISGGLLKINYADNGFLLEDETTGYCEPILSNATNPSVNSVTGLFFVVPNDSIRQTGTGLPDGSGTVDVSFTVKPRMIIDIPSEINDASLNYFLQIYRTKSTVAFTAEPDPSSFALADEAELSQSDLDSGFVLHEDKIVDEILLGALLYTNPNTREGELQENSRPPKAKYLSLFKNYMTFANAETEQRMRLNLANPEELIGVDLIFKSEGKPDEVYRAVNDTVYSAGEVSPRPVTIDSLNPLVITYGVNDFPLGSKVRIISDVNGSTAGLPVGEYPVISTTGFDLTLDVVWPSMWPNIIVQVVADDQARLYNGYDADNAYYSNVAEWVEYVARNLVSAINGNRDSFMYANYRATVSELPGLISINSKDFIEPIYVRYSTAPANPPFIQSIPDSFLSGNQFYSENDVLPNVIYFSKIGEPEAVPALNSFPVGTVNAAIVGTFPLKDSLIVLKEDGVYKIVGDVLGQMVAVPIDLTIQFTEAMAQAAWSINNTVIAFCNQGIVQITENSVQIISRRIEDVIQPLIGRDLSNTFLFGHESDRLFYVQTIGLNPGEDDVTWIYNVLNQTWTSTPDVFRSLSLGTKNELMGIRRDDDIGKNVLWRQRKTNTRVDYCGEYVIGDLTIDLLDQAQGTFTITGGNSAVPAVGDVILSNNIFNRIIEVTPDGGDYILLFAQDTAIEPGVPLEVTLYKAYESVIKMAPFHAGQVGRSKHFAQMQIHLRQQVLSRIKIEFAGAFYGSSEVTGWKSLSLSTAGAQGWGFSPWGLFPWGLVDGANIVAGTEPASIIRTYVPRFAARNTFIQPILTHFVAGEPLFLQAISWSVHGYGERTSR